MVILTLIELRCRNLLQQVDVARHQVGLGGDGEPPPAPRRKDFENGTRAPESPFGRLIGIGRGADGDGFGRVELAQLLPQDRRQIALGVDLILEERGVLHSHELVGVAGVAIFAAEFAAAIRIDGPAERHARPGAIQDAAGLDFEIPHSRFGFEHGTSGSQPGNAGQRRRGRIVEQHFL